MADGEDITDEIRTPEISMLASSISARPVVRAHLLGIQRRLGRGKGAVFEGRDMGTVVFPEADVKFFLDASEPTRASRRCAEFRANPTPTSRPSSATSTPGRSGPYPGAGPLRPAPDAIMSRFHGLDRR